MHQIFQKAIPRWVAMWTKVDDTDPGFCLRVKNKRFFDNLDPYLSIIIMSLCNVVTVDSDLGDS